VMVASLRSVLDFLGPGNLVLGILLLIATPFVDRFLIRRKRIGYRVLYNSRIGLGPEKLHDEEEVTEPHLRRLGQFSALVDRMSIVVVRIRNTGGYDIDADDFERSLAFTFGRRVVWNARVSDASTPELRAAARESLRFFSPDDDAAAPARRDNLGAVRRTFRNKVAAWVGRPPADPGLDTDPEPRWHGVRIDGLVLRRREKFKLVVVLREPQGAADEEITKDIAVTGRLRDTGLVKDERSPRRFTLARITGGLAVGLTALLVTALVFSSPKQQAGAHCASGTLRVEGSSVFMPTVTAIAQEYQRGCPGASITTQATGSIDGVRAVTGADPATAAALIAVSDGKQGEGLRAEQLAIVVYQIVVNASAGVTTLTGEQLRGIHAGAIRDWSQLRGGAPLPIRVVGRGQESGTRELFERAVLGTAEGGLSSNDCREADRAPNAPVIRCERNSNSEIVTAVSTIEGAIGYSDTASVAEGRKRGALTAVSLDGRLFDIASGVESGYPFWTVEYLYTKEAPTPGTLQDRFLHYLRDDQTARLRLKEAGYLPCTTADNAPLPLCNKR